MGIEHRSDRLSPPDVVVLRPELIHEGWAVYNRSTIKIPEGIISLSRAVYMSSILPGEPDVNVIVVAKTSRNGRSIVRFPDLNLPIGGKEGEVFNWEDPRILERKADDTKAIIGLTAVCVEQEGSFQTHPALVKVGIGKNGLEVEGTKIFKGEKGKNVVPLSEDKFIYRPEGQTHVLHIVTSGSGDTLTVGGEIDFSKHSEIDWIREKVGAVSRPFGIGNGLSILPIHGVRNGPIDSGIDAVYSIGLAVISENWKVLAVDPDPLLKREDFLDRLPIKEDLDPKKQVVYCCDYVESRGRIIFGVSPGDRINVLERFKKFALADRAMSFLKAG